MKTRGQRGRAKATIDLIYTCSEIIEQAWPITVRGVCYKLFVARLILSMATGNTQRISRILTQAREEGLIPWEWIVDDSRRMEGGGGFKDLRQYARAIELSYRRDFWAHQPWRVIVVSEKSTVAGILAPTLDEYGVQFFAAHGFNSATKVHDLAAEIATDPRATVLLYAGDYDPSGMYMSEADLPKRLTEYGAGGFTLKRIALLDQDLPGLPGFDADTKKKDPRYRWFVERYGREAWELDAMDPNDLRARVTDEIEQYVDADYWARHKKVEDAQRETVKTIAERMAATV